MISARFRQDQDGQYTACEVSGHSGYAEEGSDIICAAVSALTVNCVNSLESVCGIRPAARGGKDGLVSFSLPGGLTPEQRHDAQILMRALKQGLSDIAGEYPKYVTFSILNGGKQP